MKDRTGTEIQVGNFLQMPDGRLGRAYVIRARYVHVSQFVRTAYGPNFLALFEQEDSSNTTILDRSLFTPLNPDLWTQEEKLARLAWLEEQCPDLD